jgi:pilus assembly protein TadC
MSKVPSSPKGSLIEKIKSIALPKADPEEKRRREEAKRKEAEDEFKRQQAIKQRELIAKDVKKKAEKKVEQTDDDEPLLPKRKKVVRRRRSLKELLQLAGMDYEPIYIYKRIFIFAVLTNLILTALSIVIGFYFNNTFVSVSSVGAFLGFIAAMWTVVFLAIVGAYFAIFAVYLDLRINARRKEIEAVFPDYLQLAAANLSAGMTIDRALWAAVRPRFGVLAKEMEEVAKKTMTGYELERALGEFSEKYDSITLKRSISLIVEGIRSGGRLADILNKISINMQENSILQKEMSANVTTYVIFISFATIMAAPVLFALSTQLLLVIKKIAGSIATEGGSSVGLSINANVIKTSDFEIFCLTVLTISSVMSACIVSAIRKGNVKDGIRLIPIFWIVSVVLYYIAAWGLGFMFGGLL